MPIDPENERNVAGIYGMAKHAGGASDVILWGAGSPAPVTVDDSSWLLHLRKRRWPLPFTITLDKFTRELHPGTNMARVYMSDVTRIDEDGTSQKIKISMNQPLRYKGYTFFQSGWGPQNARPGTQLYSTFAVVRNPADAFPLYACIIITFGMALHFVVRLVRHLRAESRRQT